MAIYIYFVKAFYAASGNYIYGHDNFLQRLKINEQPDCVLKK